MAEVETKEHNPMGFGAALEAMKQGRHVAREGWNGKGMHIYIEDMMSFTPGAGVFKGQTRRYPPFVVLFNAQQQHQAGWVPSQADMMAEDWVVVR